MAEHDAFTKKQLKNFGNRLKQLRKERGYSNYEVFAYEHGINRVSYGSYEAGKANPTLASIVKITKALDIGLDEFFSEGF